MTTMDTLPLDVLTVLGVIAWAGWFVWLSVDEARRRRAVVVAHRYPLDLHNLGMVRAQRTEHGVADDQEQGTDADTDTDEPDDRREEQFVGHARMVHLPPGVPSITERMDPWLLDLLSEDVER